jgi:DNA-binding LacI/PurR family transcriptional regulator
MTSEPTKRLAGSSGMVTIKDIARVVGVANSTVARALNDHPRISDETKIRVRAAARDLGYVVHSAARLMRGESSMVIGLTVPDINDDFFVTVARAVAGVCRESGFQLMLSITDDDPDAEYEHIRALAGAQAAGAIIVPTSAPLKESQALLRRLPFVQLARHLAELRSDWFAIDDERGLREATGHLIGYGHRRIAYLGPSPDLSTGQDRLMGFHSSLLAAGIAADPALVWLGGASVLDPMAAFSAFREMYLAHKPTAVIAGGSLIAAGMLRATSDLGLSVPGDLSVIGYNDVPLYQSWRPQLTAIALPVREMALSGATLLIRRIVDRTNAGHEDPLAAQTESYFVPRLIVRQSTAEPDRRGAGGASRGRESSDGRNDESVADGALVGAVGGRT